MRFKHFNMYCIKEVIADMPLSGAYNQKMAAIRLILTAEYERLALGGYCLFLYFTPTEF